jgi:hypothetical protein
VVEVETNLKWGSVYIGPVYWKLLASQGCELVDSKGQLPSGEDNTNV